MDRQVVVPQSYTQEIGTVKITKVPVPDIPDRSCGIDAILIVEITNLEIPPVDLVIGEFKIECQAVYQQITGQTIGEYDHGTWYSRNQDLSQDPHQLYFVHSEVDGYIAAGNLAFAMQFMSYDQQMVLVEFLGDLWS